MKCNRHSSSFALWAQFGSMSPNWSEDDYSAPCPFSTIRNYNFQLWPPQPSIALISSIIEIGFRFLLSGTSTGGKMVCYLTSSNPNLKTIPHCRPYPGSNQPRESRPAWLPNLKCAQNFEALSKSHSKGTPGLCFFHIFVKGVVGVVATVQQEISQLKRLMSKRGEHWIFGVWILSNGSSRLQLT
jgi:hypothetical protein